jgi:hypothetical protein
MLVGRIPGDRLDHPEEVGILRAPSGSVDPDPYLTPVILHREVQGSVII